MAELREHLIARGLTGEVATSPGETVRNCGRLVDGNVDYTFGLCDHEDADVEEVTAAVAAICGPDAVQRAPDGRGWIDPEATLEGIDRHRERLNEHAASRSCVLLATGHPTGLLGHYIRVAAALRHAGCELSTPVDDEWLNESAAGRQGLRYVQGVGCTWNGGDLQHTHRPEFMQAALDRSEEQGTVPDLVIGDHGMAGAAIERGIETLSIADVNDPALPLAVARGRTDGLLVIDDNLAPRLFEPVTDAMLRDLSPAPRLSG